MGVCMSSESRSPLPGSPTGVRKTKGSKRSAASWNSSFDHSREKQLHRTPERLILNGSSEIASIFTQKGKKGINQDAMIVWEPLIYGRGATPGMSMMPMLLPDGRIGYVLQQQGVQPTTPPPQHRGGRSSGGGSSSGGRRGGGGDNGRGRSRYNPY